MSGESKQSEGLSGKLREIADHLIRQAWPKGSLDEDVVIAALAETRFSAGDQAAVYKHLQTADVAIVTEDDLKKLTGLPILGVIPEVKEGK